MRPSDGGLTRGELAFSEAYVRLGDREAAEKAAGIAPLSGYKVLKRPEVQREIVALQTAKLTSEALPIAVQTLIGVMQSDKAPAAARVAAAKVVLDRTLGANGEGQAKDLHEMTPDELSQAISKLEAQAASMAKPVSGPDPFE
jgi:hypothetical protein